MSTASPRRTSLIRPLPRLPSAAPPPGTVYVVERLGRFHRLLHSSPAPAATVPVVDKVIAAYSTRKVRQSAPGAGIIASLSPGSRVHVRANWTLRLADAKKLAYRVEHPDRCVQLLVAVRVREAIVPLQHAPRTPQQLEQLSEAIRAAVDLTASKFGVRCLSFSVLSVSHVDARPPQPHDSFRSHMSDMPLTPSVPLAPAPHVDAVLPELPMDRFAAPHSPFVVDAMPFHYPQQPNPSITSMQPPQPYVLPVLAALPPPQLEPPASVNMSALPAPEYVPPMERTRSTPQLPNVPRPMSYPFRPQFPPLVWPQPVDQEQSDASASSLDIPLSTHPVRSSDPLVSEIASRKETEQAQSMPNRRSFSEPNIAKNRNALTKPKLPVVQYTSVDQHDESDPSSPVEPRSSSAESQSSAETRTSTEQPAVVEESSQEIAGSAAKDAQHSSASTSVAQKAQVGEQGARQSPQPVKVARKALRAPPSSPMSLALKPEGDEDLLSARLTEAFRELEQDPNVEFLSPEQTSRRGGVEEFSPNFAKYLHELPPTPSNQLPSSESSDTAETAVGKPLPMEARIPGVSDRPPTDDDEDDFAEAGDRAVDGATTEAGLVPFFPSVSSLGEASAAATAAAVAKLVVVDSNGDDPPSSIDNPVQAENAATGAPLVEQPREAVRDAQHTEPESKNKEHLQVTQSLSRTDPSVVAPVAVTPLPSANRDAGEHSLHQIRDTMKAEDEENSSTEAVHDKDISSSEDEEHGRAKSSYDSKRRQKGTTSLLGSVVGKTERALRSTGATFASDLIDGPMRLINTRSRTPRIKDSSSVSSSKSSSSKSSRLRLPKVLSPKKEKRSFLAREAELEERLSREIGRTSDKRTTWPEKKYDEDQWDSHYGEADARDRSHEEDLQDREERLQRARFLDELDGISRTSREEIGNDDDDSTDAGSLDMCMDDGSDSERATFDEAALERGEAYNRQKRAKSTSHRRKNRQRRDRYESSRMYDSDSSSDSLCEECGRFHGEDEDEHEYGRSSRRSRRGKSRSRSRSHDVYDEDELDSYHSHRSSSKDKSGRHRRSSSERDQEDRSSSRKDRHRSKKSSVRDKSIDKDRTSSKRSRTSESKSSHSRKHSTTRKSSRDIDGEKRHKSSKSKSKKRHEMYEMAPSTDLYYPLQDMRPIKSIYRHRLPNSESEEENPIPWYCEGQSEPEDTDVDEYPRPVSNERRRGANVNPLKYSSYGSRDRRGRRRRAHHSRSVHFLYDELRR
ncbi:hypothetical protein FGB62_12g414 [Gracilaria domingensis]|nr:hypothetical protein FGB62_12g414 [Gracilaria domingensis]